MTNRRSIDVVLSAKNEQNLDLSKKKKKPKKPFDLDAADDDKQNDESTDQPQNDKAADDLDDLGDLLLKKKKKKKKAFNLDDLENSLPAGETEPAERQAAENEQQNDAEEGVPDADLVLDGDLDFNLPLKKKKKKKVALSEADLLGDNGADPFTDGDRENQPTGSGQSAWANSDRDYTYDELLELVFNIIKEKNPEIAGERKKLVMRPPQVLRVGTKKSSFANFIDMCKS